MFGMCMGKISLKAKLISDEENIIIETFGIRTRRKIVYKENDITVTILIFDNKIEMNRLCNDYKVNLVFEKNKKTISNYEFFGGNKIFELETYTKKLNIDNNKIEINYVLEENNFKYTLEMEDL